MSTDRSAHTDRVIKDSTKQEDTQMMKAVLGKSIHKKVQSIPDSGLWIRSTIAQVKKRKIETELRLKNGQGHSSPVMALSLIHI